MQSTSLPEYIPPICHLIELCRRPFLKEKISDENSYSADVLQALSLLGQLAMSNDHQVTSTVAKTVAAFYTEEPNRAFLEGEILNNVAGLNVVVLVGLQMTKQTFNAVLVERSGVAKSLVEVSGFFGCAVFWGAVFHLGGKGNTSPQTPQLLPPPVIAFLQGLPVVVFCKPPCCFAPPPLLFCTPPHSKA